MVFIGYPNRRRDVPFRFILPNLLTTIALCTGMASIHFSLKATTRTAADPSIPFTDVERIWEKAIACIFVAAIFDVLDGRAARMLRAQSSFGAILDSLSDLICFGVAPAMLLHQWTLSSCDLFGYNADILGLAAVMTFVLCSALRLARFTAAAGAVRVPPGTPEAPKTPAAASHYFVGLPTPAAAVAVLIPAMLAVSTWPRATLPDWFVMPFTFAIAILMIGRQHMFSLKKLRIPRRWVMAFFVLIGLIVVGVAKAPFLTISIIAGLYVLSAPLSVVMYRRLMRKVATDPSGDGIPSVESASLPQ